MTKRYEMSLTDFLKPYTTKDDHNFISLKPNIIKYKINVDDFWNFYDNFCSDDKKLKELISNPFSFLEVPKKDFSILRFDIDIYPANNTDVNVTRLYSDQFVTDLIKKIHFLITDVAGKECDNTISNSNHYITCVFQKAKWVEKDGLHIILPNLFVKHDFQDSYFTSKLNQFCLSYEKPHNVSKIIADKISKKAWVILNCSKNLSEPYQLTSVLNKNIDLISTIAYEKPSLYSINRNTSFVYGTRYVRPICKTSRLSSDIDKDFNTIIEWDLLNKLAIFRSENYDNWIEVGIILYNIGGGDDRFLNLWKEFSQKCPSKYDEYICEAKWATFTTRNCTIRSLFHFFKFDNGLSFENMVNHQNVNRLHNELFAHITNEEITKFQKGHALEHYHIARIFHSKYCNDIVWAPLKNGSKSGDWYQFNGTRWVQICVETLKGKINEELNPYVDELFDTIKLDKSEDDEKTQKYINSNQYNIKKKLNNNSFIGQTLDASKSFFINPNFHKLLDANKFLIGCENGVIDLEKKSFRTCSPDDFISMSTGIFFKEPSEEEQTEVLTYLEEVFGDSDLVENVLEIMASLLVGSNDDKNIIIALGPTNAGKTQLVKLYEKALGDYSITFPKEIVYQRSISSASARPELSRVEGKRIAFVNELSKDERMNVATMKELSGNDKFYARPLYSEGYDITPMFTMYLSCNEVPRIPQDDEALWGRLLIIEFKSCFTSEAPIKRADQLEERQFPRIPNMEYKLTSMAPVLLWMLFEKYKTNQVKYSKGIPKCLAIRNATRKFREENNPVFKFIAERITIDKSCDDFIKCTDLFKFYSDWYKSYFPDQKIRIQKDKFKDEFIKFTKQPIVKRKPNEYTNRKVDGWINISYGEKTDDTSDEP